MYELSTAIEYKIWPNDYYYLIRIQIPLRLREFTRYHYLYGRYEGKSYE